MLDSNVSQNSSCPQSCPHALFTAQQPARCAVPPTVRQSTTAQPKKHRETGTTGNNTTKHLPPHYAFNSYQRLSSGHKVRISPEIVPKAALHFCPRMVGTIPTMQSLQLIKQLEADGWMLRGSKGSHHVFTHPTKPGHVSVPHPRKDLGVGLVHQILKQAGLK